MGRLLARLHQLGEAHPASVPAPLSCVELAGRLPLGAQAEVLGPALRTDFCSLPAGASHGRLGPQQALYIGDRCSAVLPSGEAHSGPLVLDVARAACAWAMAAAEQLPALRAVLSGYQALRRLDPEERDALLGRAVALLEGDERVVAAWLAGSLGRGGGDALSDIGLWVVCADEIPNFQVLERRPVRGRPRS